MTTTTPEALDLTVEPVMTMLHDHVPLALICDLTAPPASDEVLDREGLPDEEWWVD